MQFSVVKLMNWRVIHWVSYLCMKFIFHSFGPLRASKTLQDAHVFVWGWWPKRPMIVVFFTTVPVTKCDHGTEDCCAQHRCRLGTFGTALPRSEFFASEQIKGCNVHATGPTVPLPTGNLFVMCSYFSICLNHHQEQQWIGQRPQFG